jgi:CHASE2 domain-containing sensor protein
LDLNQSFVNEIRRFFISEGSIISGEFSNKLILSKDKIIAHGLTKYKMDKIIRTNTSIEMIDGLDDYIDNKIIYHGNSDKNLIKLINIFSKILYLILFFYSLLLILFSRKAINKKNNLTLPILICILLALYSLMITSIPLNFWSSQISILALFLIFLVFFKYLSYE